MLFLLEILLRLDSFILTIQSSYTICCASIGLEYMVLTNTPFVNCMFAHIMVATTSGSC